MRMGARRVVVGAFAVWLAGLTCACLRAPLGDDLSSSTTEASDASGDSTDAGSTAGSEGCHPSYDPCLPVVDDLDCDDVRALGAAPVAVTGDDEYGLDADHDGIGCET
jgi:hypothetical protein